MKLKICGIKNINDLDVCVNENVNYVGINFYANSKRFCKNGDILKYINGANLKKTKLVCVVVDANSDDLDNILSEYNFSIIQFSGNQTPEKLDEYRTKYQVWKSVDCNSYARYINHCDKLLFDNSHGRGVVFSEQIPSMCQLFGVAGGINENNITNFKRTYQNAEFFDIASGVEHDGIFCLNKLKKIVKLLYDKS